MDEKHTRQQLIDEQLVRAGWTGGQRRPVEEMPLRAKVTAESEPHYGSATEFADYVLLDDDGKPLAVVEAKKTSRDAIAGLRLLGSCSLLVATVSQAGLQLTLDSEQVGPADPVTFTISITNDTTETILLPSTWKTCDGLRIYWRQGTSAWHRLVWEQCYQAELPEISSGPGQDMAVPLKPGQRRAKAFCLVCDFERWCRERPPSPPPLFAQPGRYALKAAWRLVDLEIESPPASFTVAPYADQDEAAHAFLKERDAELLMAYRDHWPMPVDKKAVLRLAQQVIADFPESRFAAWARVYVLRRRTWAGHRSKAIDELITEAEALSASSLPAVRRDANAMLRSLNFWKKQQVNKASRQKQE